MQESLLKKLRVFAASPMDMANERGRLAVVVEDLKRLAESIGVSLKLADWPQVAPGLDRPEQVILDQLKPDTWDIFIGILWHRFGTPPGNADPPSGREYMSGTEEEFHTACRLWKQHRRPHMMFYRCVRPIPPDDLDPEQFRCVKAFFAGFAADADHPGLYHTFESAESFERLVRKNLITYLCDFSEQVQGRVVPPHEVSDTVLPADNLPRRAAFFGREMEKEKVLQALSP
jgi:hypothetical protein